MTRQTLKPRLLDLFCGDLLEWRPVAMGFLVGWLLQPNGWRWALVAWVGMIASYYALILLILLIAIRRRKRLFSRHLGEVVIETDKGSRVVRQGKSG